VKIMLIMSIIESDINVYSEHKGKKKHYMRNTKVSYIVRQVVAMSSGMELCASSGTSR
jgi:hypothetical protein